jgi:hypothetical protein
VEVLSAVVGRRVKADAAWLLTGLVAWNVVVVVCAPVQVIGLENLVIQRVAAAKGEAHAYD